MHIQYIATESLRYSYIYIYIHMILNICKGIGPRGSKHMFLQGGMDVHVYIFIYIYLFK